MKCLLKRIKNIFRLLLTAAALLAVCVSGYELWKMSERYVQEARVKNSVAQYSPANYVQVQTESAESTQSKNPFIADLRETLNKDIIGWITIPGTQIDYPFVQANDNSYYLRRDLYGNYALAGTIFTDYRASKDFTDFNTVIYGHNMKNGSMFGELPLFGDEVFFEANRFGTVFLEDRTYALEIFAYMVVRSDDAIIYGSYGTHRRNEFFEYAEKNALNYICIQPPNIHSANVNSANIHSANVVTLSTCSYQFNGARTVLLALIYNI
jgi:sortase B